MTVEGFWQVLLNVGESGTITPENGRIKILMCENTPVDVGYVGAPLCHRRLDSLTYMGGAPTTIYGRSNGGPVDVTINRITDVDGPQ